MPKKRRRVSNSIYNDAHKRKDEGGVSRQGFIDWKKLQKKDERVKFYSPKESSTNKINIIPYEIKTKNHPLVKAGTCEIGDLDFMLDVWVHRYIGPNSADVFCLKKNYGKACPICEEVSKYYDEGKKDEAKSLQATRRVLINVQPIVRGEAQELHVMEVSHYLFMKELIEEAHECKDGEDIVPFADIEKGKIVKFRMEMEKLGKNDMPKFKSFDFLDRDEELDEDIVDQAVSFDEGLVILSPEEIEAILFGQDEDEDDKKEEKTSKKKDQDDEAEEEEAPPKKKDKDEEEEEKEEKPSKAKCPNGHKWGEAGKHGKDCKGCDEKLWDECCEYTEAIK